MDTLSANANQKILTGRGRPKGITPEQYDHAAMLSEFKKRSRLATNVSEICTTIHISRQHFYDILNGRVNPTRGRVAAVAEQLGLSPSDVIHSA